MAGNKYIANSAGQLTEVAAIQTSTGAGDAGKIPALDSAGRLALNMMPTGVAPDVAVVQASENLAPGDLVNIWNSSGSFRVRKADASTAGKEAHGFVKDAFTSGQNATIYFEGPNDGLSGLSPGKQFLSTTPGLPTATAPSSAGNVVQLVGIATSATSMNFQSGTPITLA
jgi:hypothetical protein